MKTVILHALQLLISSGLLLAAFPQLLAFAQPSVLDQMMNHMRFTHSQLANNIDEIKQLIKNNNTAEALTLLDGMDLKIDHMNTMFNDLVWELSNKGH
jgi:uncharacterized membrane protein SpoIIM required for sporulation